MSRTAIHFLHGGINPFLSTLWPYVAGGLIVLLLLLLFLLKIAKRGKTVTKKATIKSKAEKKKNVNKKPPKQRRSVIQTTHPDATIQSILQSLPKSNGQAQTLLLAGSRLTDLPVTVPINLAIHLAEQGRCLLIDLDSKRDALAKVFEIDSSGIDTDLRVAPVQTSFENVSIWPARYFDLLKQMNLGAMLDAANKKYDHILLYAPYLTVLVDRKQIASCTTQAVVFCKQSTQDLQNHLHRLLKTYNCKVLCEV